MSALLRIGVAFAFAVWIPGCAMQPPAVQSAAVTWSRTKLIPADQAKHAVTIGKSTKADVIGSLGETLVITFDSGYEVWVYRLANDMPAQATKKQHTARTVKPEAPEMAAEFVILFAPSGVVMKTRIRPSPQRVEPILTSLS